MLSKIKTLGGHGSCTICSLVYLIFALIVLIASGFIFNVVGLVYSCLSLKEVTDSKARICLIMVIAAYAAGFLSNIYFTCSANENTNGIVCCGCFGMVVCCLLTAFVAGIFAFAHIVYFDSDRDTYCNKGSCSMRYTISMLGFIISNYIYLGILVATVFMLLILCCAAK
jgi:hypothetical protein